MDDSLAQGAASVADRNALPAAASSMVWNTWVTVAGRLHERAQATGMMAPDVLVLVPSARLIPVFRAAWAVVAGDHWAPRVESASTLRALHPAQDLPAPSGVPEREASQPALLLMDPGADAVAAQAWLHSQRWLRAAARGQPQGTWRLWARELVSTAHELLAGCAEQLPAQREAYWQRVERALPLPATGPGDLEAGMARIALGWAQDSATCGALTGIDACRDEVAHWLLGPGRALAVLDSRQHEPGWSTLVAPWRAHEQAWRWDLDALMTAHAVGTADALAARVSLCEALDATDEARRAAHLIMAAVAQMPAGSPGELADQGSVALVSQDRELVRRVCALLARRAVAVRDETGWRLSTTRAAAAVDALVRLAGSKPQVDDLLDLLKCGFMDLPEAIVDEIERSARRRQWRVLAHVRTQDLSAGATQVWTRVRRAVALLCGQGDGRTPQVGFWPHAEGRRSLWAWLNQLALALDALGMHAALHADAAGAQLLRALGIATGAGGTDSAASIFERRAKAWVVDLPAWSGWLSDLLESNSFIPVAPQRAQVVVAPLAQCCLRPFAVVVMPGCDDSRLRVSARAPGWLTDAQRLVIGGSLVDRTRNQRWQQLSLAMDLLARQPRLHLSWRRQDADKPLGVSALIEHWRLRHAMPEPAPAQSWTTHETPVQPVRPPLGDAAPPASPSWRSAPVTWQATHYADLRSCPYRYFALHVLGLREAQELTDDLEKRDLGTWLHAVLHGFHAERTAQAAEDLALDPTQDLSRLMRHARAQQHALGHDEGAFLPMWLRFGQLAPLYLKWLHEHEAQGWRFQGGELKLMHELTGDVRLRGTLDRVDRNAAGATAADAADTWVLDYKLQRKEGVRERLGDSDEDTQLAFYALLLLLSQPDHPATKVRAAYVFLDEPAQVGLVEHKAVSVTAYRLLDGLQEDVRRLRAGHGLPALGEGRVCDWCTARGVCRKDHWPAQVPPAHAQDAS